MNFPVLHRARMAAFQACLRLSLILLPVTPFSASVSAAEKEKPARPVKSAAGKPESSKAPDPASAPKAETEKAAATSAPAALESVCAAIEPFALRTELARPLGNGKQTVIVPAREDNVLGLTHFSREEFAAAGLDWDQFLAKAQDAATRLLVSISPQITRDKEGHAAYATLKSDRPFAASVVLSPRLLPLFREEFGDRLVLLLPDRHTVYIFPRNFSQFQDFGPRVVKEYEAALYPCSREAFELSQEGLKCLGAFGDGSSPDDSAGEAPAAPGSGKAPDSPAKSDPKASGKKKGKNGT